MRKLAALLLTLWLAGTAQSEEIVPLPEGDKTPFPTTEWSEPQPDDALRVRLEGIAARAFEGVRPTPLANTKALVVVVHGRIAAERYGPGITRDTRLQSWSMAKSVLHAVLGLAIGDGKLDPDAPAPVPEWQSPGDSRGAITIRQLAQMTDGLAFREDYDDTRSEAMQMLFGAGRGDVGSAAARAPLAFPPGTHWSYSSGSANILSRILRDALGGREAYAKYLRERLFDAIGMRSAVAEFDASGTWIGSSYVHATARDFARFGLLYLRRGFWDGRQLLPRTWAETAYQGAPAARGRYGTLFWLNGVDLATGRRALSERIPADAYLARGFGGQLIVIVPSKDAVVVMLNADYSDDQRRTFGLVSDLLDAIP